MSIEQAYYDLQTAIANIAAYRVNNFNSSKLLNNVKKVGWDD